MLDYQRIVEEIQNALLAIDALDWDLLRDAAAEYAAACDEVNTRLDRCGKLLKQGLRSEAIQAAELEPSLLDSVATLDFPELQLWQQLLLANGMVLPPTLHIQVAADLNAAYALEAPLKSLLRNHRLLALGRAPLAPRINVLRSIHYADPDNPVWDQDLKLWEAARLDEIQKEVSRARKNNDLAALDAIFVEIESPDWVNRPRPELVHELHRTRGQVAMHAARAQLEKLEPQLTASHSEFDAMSGRAIREHWQMHAAIAMLPDHDPLAQRAAPALSWLAREDMTLAREREIASLIGDLELGLEEEAPRVTLDRAVQGLERLGAELPPALWNRYLARIDALELAARRGFYLRIGGIVAVVLFIAGLSGFLIYQTQQAAYAAAALDGFTKLINDKNLPEAQRYFTSLIEKDPSLAQRPDFQSEKGRLDGMIASDEQRRQKFAHFILKADVENERTALAQAETLAVTADELARVDAIRKRYDKEDQERQAKREEDFRLAFSTLLEKIAEAEAKLPRDMLDESELAPLRLEVDRLSRQTGVAEALLRQTAPLKVRLESVRQELQTREQQQKLLASVTDQVGDIDGFAKVLQQFATQYPSSPLAAGFKKVASQKQDQHAIQAWRDFYGDPLWNKLADISSDDARKLMMQGGALEIQSAWCPLAKQYMDKLPYLEHRAARVDESGESLLDGLEVLYRHDVVTKTWMFTTKTGDRYYTLANPFTDQEGQRTVLVEYLLSDQLETKKQSFQAADIAAHQQAPQTMIDSNKYIADARKGQWERGMYGLMREVIAKKDVDAVLRFILFRKTLQTAMDGSECMDESFAKFQQQLETAGVDVTVNWVLPNEPGAVAARANADAALPKLEELQAAITEAGTKFKAEVKGLEATPEWIGWLKPDGEDRWTCEMKGSAPGAGNLTILLKDPSNDAEASLVTIGSISLGGAALITSSTPDLIPGTPVYFLPATKPPSP